MEEFDENVNVLKFVESRAKEIATLMNEVTSKEPKLSLQRLPYHMRRRAASHNPKRLPPSLRIKKLSETPAKPHKKRKYHRSLLEDYNSRQKADSVWLPTHIWFAKRFHMKQMWGYKLPMQATGKRFRSSYRATVRNTLLQDLSYYSCIELRGKQETLISYLSSLTDDSLGLNFDAEYYMDGTREGSCFLYHPHSFPFKAIGPVSFLWKPCDSFRSCEVESPNLYRQLWIWCHPTIHEELLEVLIKLFDLKEKAKDSGMPTKKFHFASKTNYMKTKLHFQKEGVYSNSDITLMNLKDTLVRHRIIGPNSQSVLTSVLHPIDSLESSEDNGHYSKYNYPSKESEGISFTRKIKSENHPSENSEESENITESSVMVHDTLFNTSANLRIWNFLTNMKSACYIPPNIVVGIIVNDPRLYVSSKIVHKSEMEEEDITSLLSEISNPATAISALWDENIRNHVTVSQIPEYMINKERAKYVNFNEVLHLRNFSKVPVIIIRQPGVNGYGSGWDIIAPQGWGMAFWIPFIYHRAQPAGIEDNSFTNLECGCPTFPYSFPDTKAGIVCEETLREEHIKNFYKYSRAKRPNFKILGIKTPFFMPWNVLVNDWKAEFLNKYSNAALETSAIDVCSAFVMKYEKEIDENLFFTLRSWKELNHLNNLCTLLDKNRKINSQNESILKTKYNALIHRLVINQVYLKSLLLIRIHCISKGIPSKFSGIYLPNESDLVALKDNFKCFGPVEPKHSLDVDSLNLPANKRRKLLKKEAKEESKDLGKPEVQNISSSSDRKLIGYIIEGGYSRLRSQGFGIGHCALTGFLVVLEQCINYQLSATVLIREQHSFQYRLANIEVSANL